MEVSSYDAPCLMVQAGLGIGITPEGSAAIYRMDGAKAVRLESHGPAANSACVWGHKRRCRSRRDCSWSTCSKGSKRYQAQGLEGAVTSGFIDQGARPNAALAKSRKLRSLGVNRRSGAYKRFMGETGTS